MVLRLSKQDISDRIPLWYGVCSTDSGLAGYHFDIVRLLDALLCQVYAFRLIMPTQVCSIRQASPGQLPHTSCYDTSCYDTSCYDTSCYDTSCYDTSCYDTSCYDCAVRLCPVPTRQVRSEHGWSFLVSADKPLQAPPSRADKSIPGKSNRCDKSIPFNSVPAGSAPNKSRLRVALQFFLDRLSTTHIHARHESFHFHPDKTLQGDARSSRSFATCRACALPSGSGRLRCVTVLVCRGWHDSSSHGDAPLAGSARFRHINTDKSGLCCPLRSPTPHSQLMNLDWSSPVHGTARSGQVIPAPTISTPIPSCHLDPLRQVSSPESAHLRLLIPRLAAPIPTYLLSLRQVPTVRYASRLPRHINTDKPPQDHPFLPRFDWSIPCIPIPSRLTPLPRTRRVMASPTDHPPAHHPRHAR